MIEGEKSFWPGYYEVNARRALVWCDDWTMPVDEIWHSYVVYRYPKPKRKENGNGRSIA